MTWHKIESSLGKIKHRVWNRCLLLWWYRLWVRKNKFHKSLEIDTEVMLGMNKKEIEKYISDLRKRRKKAHLRDLKFESGNREFSSLLNSFGDNIEKIEALNEKLEEDILQAMERKGLKISKEHFRAILKFWGIEEIEAMMRIKAK